MPNLKQNTDGSVGLQGSVKDDGGFIPVTLNYSAPTVDTVFFTADRSYVVKDIKVRVTAAGTDTAAVTVAINKVPDGTAVASGTTLHSGTGNLKGTANTVQSLSLVSSSTTRTISDGQSLGADFTGTATAATGTITVLLAPA